MPRFSRLRNVVDFVAASLISYYGYANNFSDGPCYHLNSEWLQQLFQSPPELCRSLSQARCKQLSVSFSQPLFFLNNMSYHTVFFAGFSLPFALYSSPPFFYFFSFLQTIYFAMARLQTRAQHRAARRAISHPVRALARRAHSVSSSPPRSAVRQARQVSSAPAMALGAHKSTPSSGHKAESAPAGPPGPKSAPASPCASASGPTFLGRQLCLRCAKFAKSTPEHNCLFDKDSSKMCACCRALKSPCLPISVPYSVLTRVLIWFRSLPVWSLLAASCFTPSAS